MSRRRRRRVIAPAVASTFLCLAGRWPASQGLGRRGAGEASDRGWSIVGYNDSGPTASNVRMRDGVGQYVCEPHGRSAGSVHHGVGAWGNRTPSFGG